MKLKIIKGSCKKEQRKEGLIFRDGGSNEWDV